MSQTKLDWIFYNRLKIARLFGIELKEIEESTLRTLGTTATAYVCLPFSGRLYKEYSNVYANALRDRVLYRLENDIPETFRTDMACEAFRKMSEGPVRYCHWSKKDQTYIVEFEAV